MFKPLEMPRYLFFVVCLTLIMSLAAQSLIVQAAPSAATPTGQRLRALAGSFLIGYASRNDFWSMSDAAQYQAIASTEFNFMTPENAMKWDATEATQNVFTFSQADQHVSYAQTNNMKIHGHTLVWHSQLPSWVANGSWTSSTLTSVMYNHIDKVMNHWADGVIYAWDVVNEAFNDDGTRRSSVFQNVIGNSFIELAFQRARAADATAKLIYNDYNIETVNSKSTAVYNMISDFKNRGIPINGVGFQMHLAGAIDYNSLAQNMQRFAALGIEIYITEMDVRYPTPISSTNLQAQADVYKNVLATCRAQAMCKALQVWGIPDKYSWVPNTFPGTGAPLLFDDNYNAKPAYYAVQSGLGGTVQPTATKTNTPVAPTATKTNTPSVPTNTPAGPTPTRTNTPIGPTATRPPATATPSSTGTTCSPVNATITAPFTFDGAGNLCWKSNNLGSYINNWNNTKVTINGVNITNVYMASSQYPPKASDGYWYISYSSSVAWGHFEAK